ncbi:TPA: hypothetical protein IV054_002053 [Enterococcus faecium]|nr:hypothetical protein [Enterococcus faecium]
MTVRISKNDRAKLEKIYGKSNKARKKYNRLRQKGVEERQLPTVPTSKKRLIDYVKSTNMSRSDFNKLLDELVDFAQPYNENYIFEINKRNVAISRAQIKEAQIKTEQAQKAKEEHYKELNKVEVKKPTENTIVTPTILTELGADLPFQAIPDFNIDAFTSPEGVQSYLENIGKQDEQYFDERDQLYYDNFRQAMFTIFNSDADDIVRLLDSMGLDLFMKTYVSNFLDMNLDYIYDEAEVQQKKEQVYSKIAKVIESETGGEVPSYNPTKNITINSETGEEL